MTTEVDELIARLRRKWQVYNGRGTFRDELANPDGPEAADLIEHLSTLLEGEVERVARALYEFDGSPSEEWLGEDDDCRGAYQDKARAAISAMSLTPREQRMEEALREALGYIECVGQAGFYDEGGADAIANVIRSALSLQDKG